MRGPGATRLQGPALVENPARNRENGDTQTGKLVFTSDTKMNYLRVMNKEAVKKKLMIFTWTHTHTHPPVCIFILSSSWEDHE